MQRSPIPSEHNNISCSVALPCTFSIIPRYVRNSNITSFMFGCLPCPLFLLHANPRPLALTSAARCRRRSLGVPIQPLDAPLLVIGINFRVIDPGPPFGVSKDRVEPRHPAREQNQPVPRGPKRVAADVRISNLESFWFPMLRRDSLCARSHHFANFPSPVETVEEGGQGVASS